MLARIALAALAVAAVAADPKSEAARLTGTWAVVAAERNGKPAPAEYMGKMAVTITAETFVVGDGAHEEKATYTLDPAKTPRAINFVPQRGEAAGPGKVSFGIYELNGDTLKVAWRKAGKERPAEFKSADGTVTYMELKRK